MADPKSKNQTKGKGKTKTKGKGPVRPATKRYTPPPPKARAGSPLWVPATMFALLLCGAGIVILNYLGVLPGEQQNTYLFLGLAEITLGFIFATTYR